MSDGLPGFKCPARILSQYAPLIGHRGQGRTNAPGEAPLIFSFGLGRYRRFPIASRPPVGGVHDNEDTMHDKRATIGDSIGTGNHPREMTSHQWKVEV